ncbi:MAG: GNAT family N-acetyltransferase [Candidatus Accumulibacter sp.]|jgi:CelD/BcsL family acetyltransferase involved in cellulose biosynthesis|nr:GNAT family N-acetyltransferase [Accumulibacter sp.]
MLDASAGNPTEGTCADLETLRNAGLDMAGLSRESPLEARPEWFELLRRSVFAGDPGVRYHYLADGGRVTALLPVRLAGGIVRKVEALSNYYTSLYAPLLADEADAAALRRLLERAAAERGGVHVMRFAPMDRDARIFRELQDQLRAIGWKPFRFFCFGNWYLKVERDWEHYLGQRSANQRGQIKRKTRRFSEAGGLMEVIAEARRAGEALAAFQEVYSASWKTPEPHPEFIPALVRHLAARGALRMGVARLNGQAVAAQLWFVTGKKACIYKVAYHEAFASHSLGYILTAHLLRHVIEQDRVAEVDFLIGDEEYKKTWMSDRRERWGIIAYNPRTLPGAALALREIAARGLRSARAWIESRLNTAPPDAPSRREKGSR